MEKKIKIAVLALIIFAGFGGLFIYLANQIAGMNDFMYIPGSFTNGENAYNRGWSDVGINHGPLVFTRNNNLPTLQITTNDVSKFYSIEFEFRVSYYVKTEFQVNIDQETDIDNPVMNVVIMRSGHVITAFVIIDLTENQAQVIILNNTKVSYHANGIEQLQIPISRGGMDAIRFEITGTDGIVQFVDLKGTKL